MITDAKGFTQRPQLMQALLLLAGVGVGPVSFIWSSFHPQLLVQPCVGAGLLHSQADLEFQKEALHCFGSLDVWKHGMHRGGSWFSKNAFGLISLSLFQCVCRKL